VSLDPLKCTFLADYISAHRECCAPKILHALEIDKTLIAHTRSGTGVPQKNSNCENLKFGLKYSVCTPITSGPVRVSPQNIFHTTCRQAGVIKWVYLLEGRPPKIWEGQKTSKFQRDFWQLSTLIANIPGTGRHVKNLTRSWTITTSVVRYLKLERR